MMGMICPVAAGHKLGVLTQLTQQEQRQPRPLPLEVPPQRLALEAGAAWGQQRPPPPPSQRPGGAAHAAPSQFRLAGTLLGNNCPSDLRDAMVPYGMRFFTANKTLEDPKAVCARPFEYACKLCQKVGHEAFECEGEFQVNGKRHLSFRE